jgi:hypothetical protein
VAAAPDGKDLEPTHQCNVISNSVLSWFMLQWRSRADGKEWDTIKPLAGLGFDLNRTLLVDNDHYKSAEGEEDSMLLVPHWEQCPGEI